MRYVFKSKADADLLMMQPVGDQMLRLIGREPGPQGIIEAAALPEAIRALEAAVAAERAQGEPGDDADDRDGAAAVGLGRRAWPLLQMMRRSLAERADIVWGV